MSHAKARREGRPPPGAVRIIAGAWRGRRVPVVSAPGLRPTADRVRETLFNWLAPLLPGARCLDLFAGTGALGLEALSRDAAEVVFVERDAAAAQAIEACLQRFGARDGRVVQGDAGRFLAGAPKRFDIVFLDPPFDAGGGRVGLGDLCTLLGAGWLAGGARIYLELPAGEHLPSFPAGWELLREKIAGQVRYALVAGGPPPEEKT